MTAILGYTKRIGGNSLGVLCADDLEGHSKTKVDKLTKLAGRFVVAVAGLEIVDWVIGGVVGYMDQFSPSSVRLNSITDLENVLTEILPYTFSRWREANIYKGVENQLDSSSILVVLDTDDNLLYFADLGKVWRSPEVIGYRVRLDVLEDGMYCFGVVAKEKYTKVEGLNTVDDAEAMKVIAGMMSMYAHIHQGWVGNIGAIQVSVIGENAKNEFRSCFPSFIDYVENQVRRALNEKNS